MKRFIESESRAQAMLFPERLDDWIAEDNPVRAVDAFVDELDLANAFARINEDPESKRWNEWMATMQRKDPRGKPEEWWSLMPLAFDTEWPQHRPSSE